jgi:hypothetical protein
VSAKIDARLKKQNFTALRSNSIFCTTNYGTASAYGDVVFVIFPINGFSYTWSPQIRDLTVDFKLNRHLVNNYMNASPENKKLSGALHSFMRSLKFPSEKFVQWHNFKQSDLKDAINKEIYIHGKFVAINHDDFSPISFR